MTTWDPSQYLRFERERTLPCRDLIARIGGPDPVRVVDLGCGSGTSTALLRERWPGAALVGVDNSAEMIAAARRSSVAAEWLVADIGSWQAAPPFDLVFSNAALHWLPDHERLFPHLLRQVAPGGTLAVQMPINFESPAHRAVREVAASPGWARRWPVDGAGPRVGSAESYYRLLAKEGPPPEIWQTEYVHVLPDAASILEWLKGTTLRPYLTVLSAPQDRDAFLAEIEELLRSAYPPQPDGRVLFPFRRLFLVARR